MKKQHEWFTVETIDDDTYAISEYGHWEQVHSYLLVDKNRALLIDTGLGVGNILEVVRSLTSAPVTVVTTHAHWDHIGGHGLFSEILIHKDDAGWLEYGIPIPLDAIKNSLTAKNFTKSPPPSFDVDRYELFRGKPAKTLEDNEIITIGSRKLQVLHTPGHSPGHICLYEEERGYLFTGDLVYLGTLYAFYPSTDPVLFKQSIERLCRIKNINTILPGHHQLPLSTDVLFRIAYAFKEIESKHQLCHGSGVHDFGDFSIKL